MVKQQPRFRRHI